VSDAEDVEESTSENMSDFLTNLSGQILFYLLLLCYTNTKII